MGAVVLADSVTGIQLLLAAVFTGICAIVSPLLLRRAQAKEKRLDRKREDKQKDEELRQRKEVALTAERAAKLLLAAQADTKKSAIEAAEGTKEVARQLSEGDSEYSKKAVQEATPVVLSYPNGQRQEVVLSGVPHVGERIRLRNGRGSPALLVDGVLWMEAFLPPPNPSVIIVVRPDHSED